MTVAPKKKIDWAAVAKAGVGVGAIMGVGCLLAKKPNLTREDTDAFGNLIGAVWKFIDSMGAEVAPQDAPKSIPKAPVPPLPPGLAEELEKVHARINLDVSRDATADEIRSAFRARLLKVHPDRGGDADETRQLIADRDLLLKDLEEKK